MARSSPGTPLVCFLGPGASYIRTAFSVSSNEGRRLPKVERIVAFDGVSIFTPPKSSATHLEPLLWAGAPRLFPLPFTFSDLVLCDTHLLLTLPLYESLGQFHVHMKCCLGGEVLRSRGICTTRTLFAMCIRLMHSSFSRRYTMPCSLVAGPELPSSIGVRHPLTSICAPLSDIDPVLYPIRDPSDAVLDGIGTQIAEILNETHLP
ncbi:hypothetical protein GGS24DRAFT_36781 [Hypoxylon argillaceum]|nr:hypothetical protein GGS24DRAFT_36781 [Hypoxylon argillaceum]